MYWFAVSLFLSQVDIGNYEPYAHGSQFNLSRIECEEARNRAIEAYVGKYYSITPCMIMNFEERGLEQYKVN